MKWSIILKMDLISMQVLHCGLSIQKTETWNFLDFEKYECEFVTKSRKAQASSFKIANVKTVYQKNKALMNFRIFKTRQSLAL